jgi:hypothetical protein
MLTRNVHWPESSPPRSDGLHHIVGDLAPPDWKGRTIVDAGKSEVPSAGNPTQLDEQLGVSDPGQALRPEAQHALHPADRRDLTGGPHHPDVVGAVELAAVAGQRGRRALDDLWLGRNQQGGSWQLAPDGPAPPHRRPAGQRNRIANRPGHRLVGRVLILQVRPNDEVRSVVVQQRDQPRNEGRPGGVEVVRGSQGSRWITNHELVAGHGRGLLQLGVPAVVVDRAPQATGHDDDARSLRGQPKKRAGRADRLVVRMWSDVQDDGHGSTRVALP